ncbi:serine hydrolase domain-containing protein [Novosphingobium sp.]|uniref:serine hydrolase domain-containing protein n=1 Tax=Novosphingobium sp. TaxID=1874826 RepID=UPI0025F80BC8|nr:serine hydrolase domain-containing protein [Novosphingobium sp.]MCC6926457.1 beta-lactamase family protein [Novosphingobium sp.]
MRRNSLALAALALVLQPAAALAQPLATEQVVRIDTAAREALETTGIPSVQVAVVRDGELVYTKAWGKASETIPEATPALPYQIASNSKQFLAALLLMLENDGKLDLDDKVSKWLPELPGGERIAVRQLLSHTSGLQDFWPQDYSFQAMEQPVEPMDIVRRWGFKPLDYEPGTRWQYSNTGYVVAGIIAERAGGAPLWKQFEERIFNPLGIRPYAIDDTNGAAFPQGYHRNALGPVRPAKPAAHGWLWAAGELSMTAEELAEWDIARINRTLLPKEDWEEMERPVRLADGTSNGYGLGVYTRTVNGRRAVNHGGESVGFLSQNTVWVDDRVAVVVLTNGDFAGVQEDLTDKIAAIVLPKAQQADIGETGREADARATLAALRAGKLDPAKFTDNARYYFSAETLGDYSQSLAPLGTLTAIEILRPPRLRGGFVNRVYKLKFAKKELTLITYAEPGAQGRWEQFIVTP